MEGNDWYNSTGYTDYRNHFRGDDRPIDQSVFRGAYRLDTESPHHNVTTYNRELQRNFDQPSGNYSSGRSGNYNENQNMSRNTSRYDDRNRDRGDHRRGYWMDEETQQPESMYRSRSVFGNFEGNYQPDNYYARRGENYGNMAGSLSVGYDGNRNADWNENRYYNPLTGHRRSYHGNYTSRHPEQDNERQYRDIDRDRERNAYDRYYDRY
ncbi:hypothetical protein [Pontibacter fetidus]|uniref:Uncharacterized protein n=1 Tax=Pontibacter fetidus TaxID=2700082 RepID=A0A6B2GZL2_9BACT|nr:hypothetical protein [Pontibacter fetidus]NDK55481.1 hypothetical protein [Pontibacter fetidus]